MRDNYTNTGQRATDVPATSLVLLLHLKKKRFWLEVGANDEKSLQKFQVYPELKKKRSARNQEATKQVA